MEEDTVENRFIYNLYVILLLKEGPSREVGWLVAIVFMCLSICLFCVVIFYSPPSEICPTVVIVHWKRRG